MRQHFHLFSIGRFPMSFLSFTFTMFYFGAHFKKGAYFESSMTSVVMLSET